MGYFYSDNGVDEFVQALLPRVGFACDVGANDGLFASNTLYFEEKGWTVLCVEPNPLLKVEGEKRRKLWRQVAAGPYDGQATFWTHGGFPFASGSTICPALPIVRGPAYTVDVRTLDSLLEEAGFDHLDFLTIDAEGYELRIMEGFTLERWKPKVICLEHFDHGIDTRNSDPNKPAFIPGYNFKATKSFDVIYCRSDG